MAKVVVIQPKGLPHSHTSFLINELNANPLVVQKRLGHSDIQITLGTHSHLYTTSDNEITSQMQGKIKIQTSTETQSKWNGNQHTRTTLNEKLNNKKRVNLYYDYKNDYLIKKT